MESFPQYYTLLFNAVTDAIRAMERQQFGLARDLLIRAQRETEELYIAAEEAEEAPPDPEN